MSADAPARSRTAGGRPPDPWAERLVASSAVLLAVGLAAAWIQWAYLEIHFPALLSFDPADGWCLPREGIGIHCFADIHQFVQPNASDPYPVTSTRDFSPGASLLYTVFDWVARYLGSRAAVLIYLTLGAASLLYPIVDGVRRWPVRQALPAVLLCGFATLPFLTVLDRGNAIAFSVPALYLYVRGLRNGSTVEVAAGVAGATLMKPQFIILIIGLLALRRFRQSLWAVVWSLVALILAFSMFPPPWERAAQWFDGVRTAPDVLAPTSPQNLSLAAAAIHVLGAPNEPGRVLTIPRNLIILHPQVLGWVCAALVIALLFWRARRVGPSWTALIVLGLPAVCLSAANMYYTVIALPLAATVLSGALGRDTGTSDGDRPERINWAYVLFTACALAPIAVAWPTPYLQGPDPRNWWLTIIAVLWLATTILALVLPTRDNQPSKVGEVTSASPQT